MEWRELAGVVLLMVLAFVGGWRARRSERWQRKDDT
jgi:uncharacterized membrane protein